MAFLSPSAGRATLPMIGGALRLGLAPVLLLFACACAMACAQPVEVDSIQRSRGYGGPCVVGSVCANGLTCRFGFCPQVDAGPAAAGDAGQSDDAGPLVPGVCGDGVRHRGEACDDGNQADDDACRNSCQVAVCGDGVVRRDLSPRDDGYEICDDGNDDSADSCTNACIVAVCGDGILRNDLSEEDRAYEACDDGNEASDDGCVEGCRIATCGDGFVRQGHEACDPGLPVFSDLCDENCSLIGNTLVGSGAAQDDPASSCKLIKALHGSELDQLYWLDLDGGDGEPPVQVFCDMTTQGGGWTRVTALRRGDPLWDAWVSRAGDAAAGVLYNLPFRAFSPAGTGEDFEFFFAVDGTPRDVIYQGVHYKAWDPFADNNVFDESFALRRFDQPDFVSCAARLKHASAQWNWAAAHGTNGCAGFRETGFIVHGGQGQQDHASKLYGMGGYEAYSGFQTLEVFLR